MRDEPEEERENNADDKTGHDGKVERGVLAAVHDVAGQFSEAERQPVAKIKKSTDQNDKTSEEDKSTAEFAEGFHNAILPEPANQSLQRRPFLHLSLILDMPLMQSVRYLSVILESPGLMLLTNSRRE